MGNIYCMSDLHGHFDLFYKALAMISFSEDDFLWVLGDAIDRGPDSIKILQEIKDTPNMDMVLGNHEVMMLRSVSPTGKAVCDGPESELWRDYNGGNKTFHRYKYTLLPDERKELLSWLNSRQIIHTEMIGDKEYVLLHSYYDPGLVNKTYESCMKAPLNLLSHTDPVWVSTWESMMRDDSMMPNIYADHPDKTFITGHVPVQHITGDYTLFDPCIAGNYVNIDGGCAMGKQAGMTNGILVADITNNRFCRVPFQP